VKLLIISDRELWIGTQVLEVPQRHRKQLARMIAGHDFAVCYNRVAHAPDVRYIGNGRYVCGACERLDKATAC
jgi:hypothetical protein